MALKTPLLQVAARAEARSKIKVKCIKGRGEGKGDSKGLELQSVAIYLHATEEAEAVTKTAAGSLAGIRPHRTSPLISPPPTSSIRIFSVKGSYGSGSLIMMP